ncbi:putative leucyl-tRNA synthetase [Plesiocystis pacifica SIR-1]|uniref:Leucine--tRNA ligase n=1 Tax=Plesiocystis pacifica SIR-1 TaxID=391625 RepID=A6G370_9BACT|nr:leucine--tRNA ligase [Plesiocystis pacifica]EDM79695.1 putative leucyl-tRNA synthetase [Plesiocystis pacifica SIR-1]
MPYDHAAIEARWQAYWDEHETFEAKVDRSKPKYYVLDMFPYPSGSGLHVGHPEGYTATDIIARYKRMKGFNVLHPMGWDSFGLPAERYAMKTGTHPAVRTDECIANFKRQLKMLGFSYDWSREIATTDPGYFKWTQWIFLQLWGAFYDREAGKARPIAELAIPTEVEAEGPAAVRAYRDARRLAYLHEAPVNWCPALRIVLANEEVAEQVEAGNEVIRVPMKQWMLRITEYAQRLIDDLEGLDWPNSVLEMQRHWIGRSEGAEVDFQVQGIEGEEGRLRVFTTRPDTLFGATYMVLAPEHPLVARLATDAQREAVQAYVEATARRTERDRQAASAEGEKTGVFTGAHAINPVNGEAVPIWIADYVLMGYGTGAIMAVPGHDTRDHAFATTMGIAIKQVVGPVGGGEVDVQAEAFTEQGVAVNSGLIDGLPTAEAKAKITAWLAEQGKGEARVNYKLRDWLFSRQRYWGEPFPLVHKPTPDGGSEVAPVPTADLPVGLPEVEDFNPSETGEPPLAKATAWVELPDGSRRETNTMPQWAGSCWYYLRFCDPRNADAPWSDEAQDYWMPVDLYIGGAEHAVLHLLYARFWHKVLFDLGHVGTREPFHKLVNQGMILGATYVPKQGQPKGEVKRIYVADDIETLGEGENVEYVHKQTREPLTIQWDKMSKSRGNVINPDDVIAEYGADTMRLYEMFMGPLEASAPWQPEGVNGCFRFLARAYRLFFEQGKDGAADAVREFAEGEGTEDQRRLLHRTISEVSERIERMSFNTAISSLMVFVRDVEKGGARLGKAAAETFSVLLAPFAPHLAEEFWRALGHESSLTYAPWPAADESLLVEDSWTLVIQIKGKKRGELQVPSSLDPKADREAITKLAMASDAVERFVGDAEPRRVIYVPGKLINVVP